MPTNTQICQWLGMEPIDNVIKQIRERRRD